MIKEVRQKCKKSFSQPDSDFQKAGLDAEAQPKILADVTERSQDSNSVVVGLPKQGPGFEAHKNYLLNLISTLENYREQRMTLEKNTFAVLDEEEEDFQFIGSDVDSGGQRLSKFPSEQREFSTSNKQSGSIYDSRQSIEKKKNKRNQRLVNLVLTA